MALHFPERSWFGNFEIILTPTILFQVLELFPGSRITFKMFSVTTALCERVTVLEWVHFVRWYMQYLENCNLTVFTYTKLFMLRGGVANVRLFHSTSCRGIENICRVTWTSLCHSITWSSLINSPLVFTRSKWTCARCATHKFNVMHFVFSFQCVCQTTGWGSRPFWSGVQVGNV